MGKKVCVIEDNTPNRKLFAMLLKKAGYEVFDFENAKISLDWLKDNPVDIVLMDILLPDMNGSELLSHIKDMPNQQNIKIIAITGFTSISDRNKFISQGFDGYLSKPISTATFVNDIESFLEN